MIVHTIVQRETVEADVRATCPPQLYAKVDPGTTYEIAAPAATLRARNDHVEG